MLVPSTQLSISDLKVIFLPLADGFVPRSASRHGDEEDGDGGVELVEETLSLIVHPTNARKVSVTGSPAKPLWRKRETVRQERTVHYTTIDASGEQQVRT